MFFFSSLKAIETASLKSLILAVSCVLMILFSFAVATLTLISPGTVVSHTAGDAVVAADEVSGAVVVPHADGRESCLAGGRPHLLLRG